MGSGSCTRQGPSCWVVQISRQYRQEAEEALDREGANTNEDTVTEVPQRVLCGGCDCLLQASEGKKSVLAET